jgi:hypothetical protein
MRLYSNVLVSAYRMGFRVRDAVNATSHEAATTKNDASAIGDVDEIATRARRRSNEIPFDESPKSDLEDDTNFGGAQRHDGVEEQQESSDTPSGVVLIATELAYEDVTKFEQDIMSSTAGFEGAVLDSVRPSLDGLEALEMHVDAPGGEPTSGVIALAPKVAGQAATPTADERRDRPSTAIARVSISRMIPAVVVESAPSPELRRVEIALLVSPALLSGSAEAFVTLSLANGRILHEGACNDLGELRVTVHMPRGENEIRAHLDMGSKYKNARLDIASDGTIEYLFR